MIEPTPAARRRQRTDLVAVMAEIERCRCHPGEAFWAWFPDGGFRIRVQHSSADCPALVAHLAREVDDELADLDAAGLSDSRPEEGKAWRLEASQDADLGDE